ncbi:hypothetical protein OIU84_023104 [Salix udensis]|uniref:Uncharacterized protein n=1 Tax=Salix udensis TaxID=889485 RepID=A0AAD6PFY8_9ROSI|nr:hypothetical protein OIU84_023104 [Salix udensis]
MNIMIIILKTKLCLVIYGFLFNECCSYFVEGMHIVRRTCMTLLLLCCIQGFMDSKACEP